MLWVQTKNAVVDTVTVREAGRRKGGSGARYVAGTFR